MKIMDVESGAGCSILIKYLLSIPCFYIFHCLLCRDKWSPGKNRVVWIG